MELDILKDVISEVMKIDKNLISESSRFKEDLKCDSIELYQIIINLEDKFKKRIDNDKLLNIKTVADAVKEIKEAK